MSLGIIDGFLHLIGRGGKSAPAPIITRTVTEEERETWSDINAKVLVIESKLRRVRSSSEKMRDTRGFHDGEIITSERILKRDINHAIGQLEALIKRLDFDYSSINTPLVELAAQAKYLTAKHTERSFFEQLTHIENTIKSLSEAIASVRPK